MAEAKGKKRSLNESIIGRRNRRRKQWKTIFKVLGAVLFCVFFLGLGYAATEVLLRVSETPIPAAELPAATQSAAEKEDTAVVKTEPLRAMYYPAANLGNAAAAAKFIEEAQAAGANAVVFTAKDTLGFLSYGTTVAVAEEIKSDRNAKPGASNTLKAFEEAGLRTVAAVSAFRDDLAAGAKPEYAIQLKGSKVTAWKDTKGRRWLNPWSAEGRAYLCSIVKELAAIGIDDILLTDVCFPSDPLAQTVFPGQSDLSVNGRNQILLQFISEAKTAAGEARLIVSMPAKVALDGSQAWGGDLWKAETDVFAIDTRDAPWMSSNVWGGTKPVVEIPSAAPADMGKGSYILLAE
ncbi:MAG: putative glycoside hydrolase [Oscillospiraceae bacterium]|nr:putative glycoside hydrolase [Oscillospiraceae bacterium]